MKVIMISTDSRIFEEGSQVRKRMREYANLFEKLVVIVVGRENHLSAEDGNLKIEAAASRWRLMALRRAYRMAQRVVAEGGEWIISTQDPFETGIIGWALRRRRLVKSWQAQIHTDWLSPYFRRESLKNAIRVWLARRILPKADGIRVVSERIRDSLVESLKLKVERIGVLPIWTDIERLDSILRWNDRGERQEEEREEFVVLVVSRLTREKDVSLVVRAVNELKAKDQPFDLAQGIKLIVVGDGPEKEKLEKEVRELTLSEVVRFVGWQEDLNSYFKRADVYVLTSNYEGYGRTVIEAMAAGVPVVMTEVGVAGEMVKNGENGIVVPVGDSERLAAAIRELMEKPEKRERLTKAGRRTVEAMQTKEEYLAEYKRLIENSVRMPRALFITQKIDRDDDVLGVYHEWARRLAEKLGGLKVICLEKGRTELPEEVEIFSLGKEAARGVASGKSVEPKVYKVISRLKYVWRLGRCLWRWRGEYDTVLVHMNPEYLILAGWWWKITGKRVVFWYNHPEGGWQARVAAWFADEILATSPQSWAGRRGATIVPAGVDTSRFKVESRPFDFSQGVKLKAGEKEEMDSRFRGNDRRGSGNDKAEGKLDSSPTPSRGQAFRGNDRRGSGNDTEESGEFNILSLGRIAPVKKLETLIEVIGKLMVKSRSFDFTQDIKLKVIVDIFGGVREEDEDYFGRLKLMVGEFGLEDKVKFLGAVPNRETPKIYPRYDIFVNLTPAGSLDKTILEAMAAGVPVITSNPAVREFYPEWAREAFMFKEGEAEDLARVLEEVVSVDREKLRVLGLALRKEVIKHHSLEALVERLAEIF